MNRNLTLMIHFGLDQLLPPVLRDRRWLMAPLFHLALGPKARFYLEFKDRLPWLTDTEIQGYYSLLADTFIKRDTDLNQASIKVVMAAVQGQTVLDVACGSGWLSRQLAKRDFVVTGADIVLSEPPSTAGNPRFEIASVTSLPFPDRSFDTVICTHTLEHVRDIQLALRELRRVCRQRLIIVVPRQREYRYTFDLHIHFFPYAYRLRELVGLRAEITHAGGDLVAIEDVGTREGL